MKNRFASIVPAELVTLQASATIAEAEARQAYELARDTKEADPEVVFGLLDDWEAAHIALFRLQNITPERLAFEKKRAANLVPLRRAAYKQAHRDGEPQEWIAAFHEWETALVTAKRFGISVDVEDYSAKAATLLDEVLQEAKNRKSPVEMAEWRKLYSRIMETFTRLEISDSRYDLVMLFGLARLGSNV